MDFKLRYGGVLRRFCRGQFYRLRFCPLRKLYLFLAPFDKEQVDKMYI